MMVRPPTQPTPTSPYPLTRLAHQAPDETVILLGGDVARLIEGEKKRGLAGPEGLVTTQPLVPSSASSSLWSVLAEKRLKSRHRNQEEGQRLLLERHSKRRVRLRHPRRCQTHRCRRTNGRQRQQSGQLVVILVSAHTLLPAIYPLPHSKLATNPLNANIKRRDRGRSGDHRNRLGPRPVRLPKPAPPPLSFPPALTRQSVSRERSRCRIRGMP